MSTLSALEVSIRTPRWVSRALPITVGVPMATGRRLQYVWADRAGGGGEPQSLPLPGLLPDRQETEVPRGCRDLPKVTPASGREPRSGCCHHGLRHWVPSNLGSGRPSCCEHLVTNHCLIVFSSSWMISLGSVPRSGRPGSPGRRGAVALPSGGCSEQSQFTVSPKTGSPVRPGFLLIWESPSSPWEPQSLLLSIQEEPREWKALRVPQACPAYTC